MLTFYKVSVIPLFKDLNFTIIPGGVIYIHGDKHTGKSALLRIALGLQKADMGNVYLDNIEISQICKPYAVYIGHAFGIKDNLSVLQNLLPWAKLYKSEAALIAAIHYCGIENIIHVKCKNISSQDREKIVICRLLSCQANLWLLDETESVLGGDNLELLYNCIRSKSYNGGMICITTRNGPFLNVQSVNLKDFSL